MDMRCQRALELVWASGVGEDPESPEIVEARRHLAACPPCRGFLHRDGVLAARIRDLRLCGVTPCPESVRASVKRELGGGEGAPDAERPAAEGLLASVASLEEHRKRWPAWAEGVVAAAAAAVLIAGGLLLSNRLEADLPNEAFVEDFRRTALPEIVRPDMPPQEVEAFYRTQFGGDGPALLLDVPVTRVGVCNLQGRRGALVEYDWSGDRLVYYQVPKPEAGGARDDFRAGKEGDLNLVRWADDHYDYALIASIPEDTLARLASRART